MSSISRFKESLVKCFLLSTANINTQVLLWQEGGGEGGDSFWHFRLAANIILLTTRKIVETLSQFGIQIVGYILPMFSSRAPFLSDLSLQALRISIHCVWPENLPSKWIWWFLTHTLEAHMAYCSVYTGTLFQLIKNK